MNFFLKSRFIYLITINECIVLTSRKIFSIMPCVRAGIALRLLIDGSHLLLSFLKAQPMQDVINVIDEKLNEYGAKAIEVFQKNFFEELKKNKNWNEEKQEYKKVKVQLLNVDNKDQGDIAKLIISDGKGVNDITIGRNEWGLCVSTWSSR